LTLGISAKVTALKTFLKRKKRQTKGQLISKGLVGILNSPKKQTKKINFTTWYFKSNSFPSFFGRIEATKKDISKLTDL
jgi:hypothetical protein